MSNAFVPIVRTRPCPIFGRPVHPRVAPIDYSPILLLKPFGFRIAPNTLSSGKPQEDGFRSVLAVSGFRLCARLDFSIPSFFSQPARHYPRLWIQHPSSERWRDFNPHDSCAAQRTLWRSPTPRGRAPSATAPHLPDADRRHELRRPDTRYPRFRHDPFARDVLFDPGRTTVSRIATLHMLRSAISDSLRSRDFIISWLNHTPHATAVYASCSAFTAASRNTRFQATC